MTSIRFRRSGAALLSFLLTAPVGAQQAPAPGHAGVRAAVDVTAMDLDVVATRKGEPVTDLTKDEVTVIVTVPVGSITWLPGGKFLTGTLAGRYTLRRE